MENGVENPKVEEESQTKTADGAVSHFNLLDKVFPDEKDKSVEEELPLSIPDETNTVDGAVSQLKLVDNVVQVFHQKNKASEGDDVFEEAIMDDDRNPPLEEEATGNTIVEGSGDFDSLEANGNPEEAEDFEEAIDTELPTTEDNIVTRQAAELDEVSVADGILSVQEFPSEAAPVAQAEGTKVFTEDEIVPRGNPDAAVCGNSANGDAKRVVDDTSNRKDAALEESPDDMVCNGESNEKGSSLVFDGVATSGNDVQVESNGSCDAVVHDKSENGIVKPSDLEEHTDIFENPSGVIKSIIADSAHPEVEGNESCELTRQCTSDKVEASVHRNMENDKAQNGDMELDEEPDVPAKISSPVKVGTDQIAKGNGPSEKIFSEKDDQIRQTRDSATNLYTSLGEQIHKPKLELPNVPATPVVEKQDIKMKDAAATVDEKARTYAAVLVEKDRCVPDSHTSENIVEGSVNHAIKAPELQVREAEDKKQESTSIQGSRDSTSGREPEVHHATQSAQVPPRQPAGLGGAAPLFDPAPRTLQQPRVNGAAPQRQAQLVEDPLNSEAEENDETREKLQMIRVKFLRLAHRLGQTPHNVVVAQVLYRLGLAEQLRGRNAGRVGAFSFDRASAMAEQLESTGQEPLDFACTIMVIGKTGVGKSATINSIFDEMKFSTDAFCVGTKKVQDVVGTVQGIKVRVIDTPGLLPCWSDQRQNEKILHSVKRFIKKTPPDIVLYLDRLDMQSRDFGDLPLLRTITEIFGPSIWFNAIVVLTHAASAPPDGPNGISSSYEMFVTQRSHVVQQAIRQAAGDMRLMNPVSLVENHSACRTNRAGQRVLPNGQVWKPHLLLLSFASKILAEANTLLKLQDNPPGKPFATRPRVPPLPFLLSSLLQSRPQVKLPEEQFGDEDDLDENLDELSDSEDESEYDELPPFKPLTKAQLSSLSKAQKKAYFEELEYRETLYMKKQLREEKKRRKLLKQMAGAPKDIPNEYTEGAAEEENGGGASVPVAMPDFSLPASFDSDNPSHRYRFLDTSNPWLVRPVLETHGWDHDVGYEGINVERLFVVKDKIPVSFSGQATKDKKESNLQMELASSIKHKSEGKSTSVGFDMQTMGKDMSYTLRGETRFSNFRRNQTAAGLCVTLVGDALTGGVKLEDKLLLLNKRLRLVLTGGAMTGRGDVAYGGSLEATLRDKDYPLGRMLSTLGFSVMDWHGDLAIGCNVQSQIPIGRSSNLIARANLNNRGSGQISIRLNSAEQLQIALVGLLPLFRKAVSLYQQRLYGE
ncbi:hypothetical protein ACHQM5_024640 [Ranunculus cassubicifolius]